MQSNILTLGAILSAPSQYIIPVFQRNYRWDRPQWQKLWDSIIELQSETKVGNHFMGFLVLVSGLAQPGKHTKFHVVDGQQRITTSSIFMAALRNIAAELGESTLAEQVQDSCLVHRYEKGLDSYKLLPKAKDQKNFVAIVSKKDEPSGRIADALEFFEERIREYANGDAQSLRALYDLVFQRLSFMSATLEAENAYSIFKSLNSTGIPLGQADLIRNFVFMHVRPDDQDEFDADRWSKLEVKFAGTDGRLDDAAFSKFFRDVMMIESGYIQPVATFEKFEARYEATKFSPNDLVDELLLHARHHEIINGVAKDASEAVKEALAGLKELESSTTHPLLLSLFKKRSEGVIDDAGLAKCINMLSGFILRRFICSESSRGYGQMFVRAIDTKTANPVSSIETYLLDRGWPDDTRFRSSFLSFPLYIRGYTKFVLESLERSREHKEPADLKAAQIEHVMPQTLSSLWATDLGPDATTIHAEWLHTPGNLTLSAYNQELFNHPFERKSKEYLNSNIVITRELCENAKWGRDEIEQRGKSMAVDASTIWVGPKEAKLAAKGGSPSASGEDSEVLRDRFWTGLLDYLAEQHPSLVPFEAKPKASIRLQSGVKNIGFEVRHLFKPSSVAVVVFYWRGSSFGVWESLQSKKDDLDAAVDDVWEFGRPADDKNPRWMTLKLDLPSISESEWPAAYVWFGRKLEPLFDKIAPILREEQSSLMSSWADALPA